MGGKGRRRREKNFRAAHGGNNRLPSPPKATDLDALPSKLRRIIQFKTPSPAGPLKAPTEAKHKRRQGDATGDHKVNSKDVSSSNTSKLKREQDDEDDENVTTPASEDNRDEATNTYDKRKRKRKGKAVDELHLQKLAEDMSAAGLTKRVRRKKYLEERKKKRKKAKPEIPDFPGHEAIEFGEVVEAPPKLKLPKASKTAHDASHERLRLQAVEAYRNRKGWILRPGIHLPPVTPTASS